LNASLSAVEYNPG